MVLERITSPFAEGPIEEVGLGRTPLETVLFQVRFPGHVTKLERSLAHGDLQDRLSEHYPYAQQQETFNLVMQPGKPPEPQPGPPIWTLQSADQTWTCNLAPDSFGLSTSAYASRTDFIDRARVLFDAVSASADPPQANRIGVRYLNRVLDPMSDDGAWISTLAQGAKGILAETSSVDRLFVINTLSQVLYGWSAAKKMQCRWGVLPPQGVIDASMQPVANYSWVLDIDAFQEEAFDFRTAGVSARLTDLTERAYRFFRWVLTPESLDRFEPREKS